MGVVYHATDRLNGRAVALKRLTFMTESNVSDTSPSDSHDAQIALSREFRTLATLHHPNIIGVNEYGFDDKHQPYITMDLVENAQGLTQAGYNRPTPAQVKLLVETLQGLKYIHRRGIVHRDLKPANVLVEPTEGDEEQIGSVKILDFGLSIDPGLRTSRAAYEGLAGTIAYIAPELFGEIPATPSSDLYAVGVMAYEIFTGHYPYHYNPRLIGQLIAMIMTEQPDFSMLPPAMADVVSRMMHKQAEERYQNAGEAIVDLCRAVNMPIPEEPFEIRESFLQASSFVGRDAELKQLTQGLRAIVRFSTTTEGMTTEVVTTKEGIENGDAVEGGSLWLIGGESGVGKSRLIEELRIRAAIEGALVLRGQAVSDGGRPQELWREPLRTLALIVEMTDLEAGVLSEIVPDIGELLNRSFPAPPPLDERGAQRRLVNTILSIFQRVKQPILVVLEDLQWVEESLTVLTALVNVAPQLPVMMVGSYRSDERPDLPGMFPSARALSLTRLTEAEIIHLTGMMLGETGRTPEVIDLIQRETEGNAFFIVEVVRALAEDAGSLANIGSRTLPASVIAGGIRDIVQRRLLRVPPQAYALLKRAAIAGRDIHLPVLQQFQSDDLTLWLQICANAAVLESADGRWRFAHDKLRESLLDTLSADEKRTLNQEVAAAFEAAHTQEELHQSFALLMAECWYQAQVWDKAAQYALVAARQAHEVGNQRDALRLCERALQTLGTDESEKGIELYFSLLRVAGLAANGLGQYPVAEQYELKVLELAQQKQHQLFIQRALNDLSNLKMVTSDYAASQAYAAQSLQLAEARDDLDGRANALLSLGLALGSQGQFALSCEYFERSLALSREINNLRLIAANLNSLGVSSHYLGHYRAACVHYEEALVAVRQLGDIARVALLLANLGGALNSIGEYETSNQYQHEALRIRQQIGDRRGIVNSYNSLGWSMIRMNAPGDALEYQQKAVDEAQTLGDRRQLGLCYRDLGWVQILVGLLDEAQASTEVALKIFQETDDRSNPVKCTLSSATIAILQERHADAIALVEPALQLSITEKFEGLVFDLRCTLIFALSALGKPDETRTHLAAMAEAAHKESNDTQMLIVLACAARTMATSAINAVRAAELWSMVNAHPLKDAELDYLWLPQVRTALDAALPFETLYAAFERGRESDYAATTQAIITELTAG